MLWQQSCHPQVLEKKMGLNCCIMYLIIMIASCIMPALYKYNTAMYHITLA